jgi:hypothetical protein
MKSLLASALLLTMDARATREPDGAAAQHLADGRFTLWTTRYAIHFTAESPGSGLHARCWRPPKQFECFTAPCPG